MALSINFSKKSLVIITGASQGIGQTLAIELSKRLGKESALSLIARSEKGLTDTKNRIIETNNNVTVKIHSLDLTKPDLNTLEKIFDQDLNVDQAIIFHNVGQIGTLNKTTELTDIQNWRDYFDLNVFSVGILNSIFMKKLHGVVKNLAVINVTSLVGSKPFHDMAMYGCGKAAREMFFKVFALEETDVTVLNYSPGPVDTAMVGEVLDNVKDAGVKSMFVELKEKKTILTPQQTVEKLLGILEKGDFKSGDTIDYFDRI